MSISPLCIDIETCSAASIRDGANAYAEHDSTKVWCVSFGTQDAVDEEPRVGTWYPGDELPAGLELWIQSGKPLLAHNVDFEKAIWRHILAPTYGWPTPKPKQWHDTQALAAAANLPISLAGLADVFKGGPKKDMEGAALMRRLAKVTRTPSGAYEYPTADGIELDRLVEYCEADVVATLNLWFRLPRMSKTERAVWLVDQKINERGVCIDVDFVDRMSSMASLRKDLLSDDVFRLTKADLPDSTGTPALKAWLKEEGVELPVVTRKRASGETVETESLDKTAVATLLQRDDVVGAARLILDNRIEANKSTSLAKLKRVPRMVNKDGRLRGALRYAKAHTGRWASSGIQVHNLPKDKRSPQHRDHVLRCIRSGDLETLMLTEDRPLESMSESLRAMIVAAPGHDLLGADYSAIEARVIAWLADDTSLLSLFDAGEDVYVKAAADVGSDNRQLGKVCTLALGYGMGPLKFASTASSWGVPLSLKEAVRTQKAWRKANTSIVEFWFELEDAVRNALAFRGSKTKVGKLTVSADERCLRVRLPSGRTIRYWRPDIRRATRKIACVTDDGAVEERTFDVPEIRFFTVGPGKGAMVRESTYGGKLAENVTQAVARDLLAHALVTLDEQGFPLILHVHDSIVAEVPEGARSVDEFCFWMTDLPEWAVGCPVTAEGYRGKFFAG